MRVLVAISDGKERARIASTLSTASYEVVEAANGSVAARMFEQQFDIAFVDPSTVARARQAPQRIYVIAVVSAFASSGDYRTAFAAGADDVMRVNGPRDEILGRADALARIRSWAVPAAPATDRLERSAMWRELETIVAAELGEMLSTPMASGARQCGEVVAAAELTLTIPEDQVQMRIALGVDADSLVVLQQSLLGGDTSDEAAADALREMANVAGGAIKRAALAVGIELTIGLPTNRSVSDDQGLRRAWTLDGSDGPSAGLTLSCVATAAGIQAKVVATKELREGMVLARDVRNQMGVLIAPAGTNLTRTTVEQLSRLLGAGATLEVTDAAA